MCRKCRSSLETGNRNPHWRGGRTRHNRGYLMLYAPDHPRASHGYVFEHILVIEAHLGRHLVDGETVHHLNGIRDDNRLENLELWTKPQPPGIRVADAVVWAKEILRRYAPEALAETRQDRPQGPVLF